VAESGLAVDGTFQPNFVTFTNTDIVRRNPLEGTFEGKQNNGFQFVTFADGSGGVEKVLKDWVGSKTGRFYPAQLLATQEWLAARVGEVMNAPIRDCFFTSTDATTVIMPYIEGESGKNADREIPDNAQGTALRLFDYLTANSDRRPKNVIFTSDGRIVGIDHALCNFRPRTPSPEFVAELWNRGVDEESLQFTLRKIITLSHLFESVGMEDKFINLYQNLCKLIEAFQALAVVEKSDTFSPPQGVRDAGKKALEWLKDGKAGSGFTSVGRKRASDLARGASVSETTIRRMKAYFDRHQSDKDSPHWNEPSPGKVAWYAWGGDAGYSWAKKIVAQLDKDVKKAKSDLTASELREEAKREQENGNEDEAARLYYLAMSAQFDEDQAKEFKKNSRKISKSLQAAQTAEQRAWNLRRNEKWDSAAFAHESAARLYSTAAKQAQGSEKTQLEAKAESNRQEAKQSRFTADQGEGHSPVEIGKGGPGSGRYKESFGEIDPHVDSYDAMVPLVDELGVAIEGEEFNRDLEEPEDSEEIAPELKQKVSENIAARMGEKWADRLATACPYNYLLEQGFISGDFDAVPQVYFDHDSLYTFRSIGGADDFEAPYLLEESEADQAVENGTEVIHGDDPRIKQRLAELGASALVGEWAKGSNETTTALAIQKAAAEEFGLKNTAEWSGEDNDKVSSEYSKNGDLYRAFLRAQYDETQGYLAKNGITQVPLYRGMEFFEDEFNEITGAGGFPEIATRPLSSFSYDSIIAYKFADGTFSTQGGDYKGLVLSGVAPASRVLSCAQTGLGCYREREIVLLGGKDKWNYETVGE